MYGPVDDIIPRESHPNVKELVDKISIVIDQFVDFGSNILKWDTEIKRVEAWNTPILMSFRHFLELVDSISILVKQSSIDPCKLQLRGILESYFGLAYMLERETAKRSMAFLVWHVHQQMKDYCRSDAGSEIGKQFRKKLNTDQHTKNINIPTDPEAHKKIAALEALLEQPDYEAGEQEYKRLRELKEKNPAWYRFYDGPRNIEELAGHLNCTGMYEVVYRKWSGPVHGTDIIMGKASVAADGSAEIFQLRHFGHLHEVAQWTLTLSLMMFDLYINERISDKRNDYLAWYLSIREPFIRITSREPLIVAV